MLHRKSALPHPLSPKQLDDINEELMTRDIVVPVLIVPEQQQVPAATTSTLLQSQLLSPLTPEQQQRPIQNVVFREDAKKPSQSIVDRWNHAL